jgi:hypothetical protein
MKQRHMLRIGAVERGDSCLDAQFERDMLEGMCLDTFIARAEKEMVAWGKATGPIWDWMTGIKGVGPHTAAKVLALIDDITLFDTRSKLYRFAGLAVIDGAAEPKSSTAYCRKLKSYLIGPQGVADQFVRHHAVPYADYYYHVKEEDRRKHPDVLCSCGRLWEECPDRGKDGHKMRYNDGHINHRAWRKIAKLFLSHTWEKWREFEGLPVPPTYAEAVLGHKPIPAP